ncbi:hypothetical protein AB7M63_007136 [Bradyrhizobium japonicum]
MTTSNSSNTIPSASITSASVTGQVSPVIIGTLNSTSVKDTVGIRKAMML